MTRPRACSAFAPALAAVLSTVACATSTPAPVPTVVLPTGTAAASSPPQAPLPTMDLSKAADLLGQQVVLVVTLDPNGEVAVDREKVATDEALRARVHRAVEKVGPISAPSSRPTGRSRTGR